MIKTVIGIVDYGAGNCASLRSRIDALGYRTRLVKQAGDLDDIECLFLPGVGAFASAMKSLRESGLDEVTRQWAFSGKPLIGICLGMQLLADVSFEHGETRGLELIPGQVKPLTNPNWHIGWNRLEHHQSHSALSPSYGLDFYFNHSYEFQAPGDYVFAYARVDRPIVAAVVRDRVMGFQFHPEKSQQAGSAILKASIEGLIHA